MQPLRLGIVVHHSVSRPHTTPATVDSWHRIRGFQQVQPGGSIIHFSYHRYYYQNGKDGPWVVHEGRHLSMPGAHCPAGRRNFTHIGACLAGNFEEYPPSLDQLLLAADDCAGLCLKYGFGPEQIIGHRDAMPTKCPGKNFDLELFREMVRTAINLKPLWGWLE